MSPHKQIQITTQHKKLKWKSETFPYQHLLYSTTSISMLSSTTRTPLFPSAPLFPTTPFTRELPLNIEDEHPPMKRQYTITSAEDATHILNGRCPDYALNWPKSLNQTHWEPAHDFYMGNGKCLEVSPSSASNPSKSKKRPADQPSLQLRKILSQKLRRGTLTDRIVFCDLDGVLADFETGVQQQLKCPQNKSSIWPQIFGSQRFFLDLPWTTNGKHLWEAIQRWDPIILTGVPNNNAKLSTQKREWCARELGEDIHVITCTTKEKPNYALRNSVLIDDRDKIAEEWTAKGGQFILYDDHQFRLDKIMDEITRST